MAKLVARYLDKGTKILNYTNLHSYTDGINVDGKYDIRFKGLCELTLSDHIKKNSMTYTNTDEPLQGTMFNIGKERLYLNNVKCAIKESSYNTPFSMSKALTSDMIKYTEENKVVTFTTRVRGHQFSVFNLNVPNCTVSIKDGCLLLSHNESFNNIITDLSTIDMTDIHTLMIRSDDITRSFLLEDISEVYINYNNNAYRLYTQNIFTSYVHKVIPHTHTLRIRPVNTNRQMNQRILQSKLLYSNQDMSKGEALNRRFVHSVLYTNNPHEIDVIIMSEDTNTLYIRYEMIGNIYSLSISKELFNIDLSTI